MLEESGLANVKPLWPKAGAQHRRKRLKSHFCKRQARLNTDSRGTKPSKPTSTTSLNLNLLIVNRKSQAADSKYLEAVHYSQKFLFCSKESTCLTLKLYLLMLATTEIKTRQINSN